MSDLQLLAACMVALIIAAFAVMALGIWYEGRSSEPLGTYPTLEQYGLAYEEACCLDREWADANELCLWIEDRARSMTPQERTHG